MKINFDKYRKFILLVPVVLMLIAVVIGVIFKFNFATEFTARHTFTVAYNTTVGEPCYEKYENEIASILNENGGNDKFSYGFERLNDEIAVSTKVVIYDSELSTTQLQNVFNKVSESIEENINGLIGDGHITVSDIHEVSAKSLQNEIINLAVVLLVGGVLLFVYIWIRHELKLAISSLFMILYNVALLVSSFVLFRIPLNSMFVVPFAVVTLLSYVMFAIVADKVRSGLDSENSVSNNELVNDAINQNKLTLLLIVAGSGLAVLLSMLSLSLDVIFVSIACFVGIIIALFSAIFVAYAVWTKIYNKDNDKRLKAKKLKKEQPKTKKSKQEDKIVV